MLLLIKFDEVISSLAFLMLGSDAAFVLDLTICVALSVFGSRCVIALSIPFFTESIDVLFCTRCADCFSNCKSFRFSFSSSCFLLSCLAASSNSFCSSTLCFANNLALLSSSAFFLNLFCSSRSFFRLRSSSLFCNSSLSSASLRSCSATLFASCSVALFASCSAASLFASSSRNNFSASNRSASSCSLFCFNLIKAFFSCCCLNRVSSR